MRFGRWTTAEETGRYRLCTCDCGTTRRVSFQDLKAGKSKSCGCLTRETTGQRSRVLHRKHGMEKTPEYRTWVDMRRRCNQPQRPDYKNYGGRGIKVCPEWEAGFEAFYRDMGPRPAGHTIDRLDNDGPYSKDNCVWAPRRAQERNKRSNSIIAVFGVSMTIAEAAEKYGINYFTLHGRIHTRGWPPERAVSELPVRRKP
jgi:hypothetical protein